MSLCCRQGVGVCGLRVPQSCGCGCARRRPGRAAAARAAVQAWRRRGPTSLFPQKNTTLKVSKCTGQCAVACTHTCANQSSGVEEQHAAPRLGVGQLHRAELLGCVVGVAAAGCDPVEVERQGGPAPGNGYGFCKLRTQDDTTLRPRRRPWRKHKLLR